MHPPVLAPAHCALEATDLVKMYGSGDTAVYALDGVSVVHAFIKSSGGQGVISIPYAEIALFVAIGAGAALLAAVVPARRAGRVCVVSAMAEA